VTGASAAPRKKAPSAVRPATKAGSGSGEAVGWLVGTAVTVSGVGAPVGWAEAEVGETAVGGSETAGGGWVGSTTTTATGSLSGWEAGAHAASASRTRGKIKVHFFMKLIITGGNGGIYYVKIKGDRDRV
jgi:hypothetical protein